ncbi:uncharacterized protein LOC135926764 [Gordionus sp. m RMFG-2023]|uniref:uncharacterized protein LOC135926764 n=1 Tax=Gordionus sp. m RMFG-2023 TaxID=3053472 RepID=UPI0031FBFCC7
MVGMEIPGLERDLRALYPDRLDRDNNVLTFQFIFDLELASERAVEPPEIVKASDAPGYRAIIKSKKIQQNRENRAKLTAEINGLDVEFDFDTGAQASLIGIDIWTSIGRPKIRPTSLLTAYDDHPLDVKGETQVNVKIGSQTRTLPVVKEYNWGASFPWIIANLEMPRQETIETQCNQEIFDDKMGHIRDFAVRIYLKDTAVPRSFPARGLQFPLRKAIEMELDRLVAAGIIEKIDSTIPRVQWSTPTVNVGKSNGDIRICADFNVTLSPSLLYDPHVIPTLDDLLEKI